MTNIRQISAVMLIKSEFNAEFICGNERLYCDFLYIFLNIDMAPVVEAIF